MQRRTLLAAATTIGAAALLPRHLQATETLTLYNGQHRSTTEALVAAFTGATGIPVTIRHAESAELSSQIAEEGARSPADLFFSEQSPPIAALAERGLLAPVAPDTLKALPSRYAGPQGDWVAGNVRTRVIIYNRNMVKPDALPASIMAFGTPALGGQFAYVKRDGFQEQIMAIVETRGRDAALAWLRGVKSGGRNYNGNRIAATAVENGEVAMALSNNYYWYSLAKERGAENLNSALYTFPGEDPGNVINVSPAGVLKSSAKQEQAQRFLAFMVSVPGQKAMVATTAEYPVIPGVVSPYDLAPLPQSPVTPAQIGSATQAYALMREAGLI